MRERGIAPGLLVASPDLRDPNFAHSVVLMVQHDCEHSFGLVVNRPTGMRMADAGEPLRQSWPRGAAMPLLRGGPLEPRPGEPLGFLLHYPSAEADAAPRPSTATEASSGIVLYTVPTDAESLVRLEDEPTERLRFVVGYSSWGPGQLERELLAGAWRVADPDPHILFETPVDEIWEAAVRSIGIDPDALLPGSLVAGPEIH
jgi:putative transcriptional regulator